MNTSSFLSALRSNASLPLVFRAGREIVAAGYHLTEVKRVSYETMDCGAMTHRWSETQFEVWVPAFADVTPRRGHLPAGKFLRIVDRVEAELPLNREATARIHASFSGQPAALYEIESAIARDGQLWIDLTPDRTRCKAAERRLAAAASACGGTGSDQTEVAGVAPAGACGSNNSEPAAAACCA